VFSTNLVKYNFKLYFKIIDHCTTEKEIETLIFEFDDKSVDYFDYVNEYFDKSYSDSSSTSYIINEMSTEPNLEFLKIILTNNTWTTN